jgi:hypothetical protein
MDMDGAAETGQKVGGGSCSQFMSRKGGSVAMESWGPFCVNNVRTFVFSRAKNGLHVFRIFFTPFPFVIIDIRKGCGPTSQPIGKQLIGASSEVDWLNHQISFLSQLRNVK